MARIQRNTLPPAQATAERLLKACTVLLAQLTGLLSCLCSLSCTDVCSRALAAVAADARIAATELAAAYQNREQKRAAPRFPTLLNECKNTEQDIGMIHDGCGSCSPRGERARLRSLHQELRWEEFTKVKEKLSKVAGAYAQWELRTI